MFRKPLPTMRLPAAAPRISAPGVAGLYSYYPGAVIMAPPGVQNMVFEMDLCLPVIAYWGQGVLAGMGPNPQQPPQVYQQFSNLMAGLGGQIAGQWALQPLIVPDNILAEADIP